MKKHDPRELAAKQALTNQRKADSLSMPVTEYLQPSRETVEGKFPIRRTKYKPYKWKTDSHLDEPTRAQVIASRFYKIGGYRLILDGILVFKEQLNGDRVAIAKIKGNSLIRLYKIDDQTIVLDERLQVFMGIFRSTESTRERKQFINSNLQKVAVDEKRTDLYRRNKRRQRPGKKEREALVASRQESIKLY